MGLAANVMGLADMFENLMGRAWTGREKLKCDGLGRARPRPIRCTFDGQARAGPAPGRPTSAGPCDKP